jgi:hypothetical protein
MLNRRDTFRQLQGGQKTGAADPGVLGRRGESDQILKASVPMEGVWAWNVFVSWRLGTKTVLTM